jgi:putative transport protein
MTVGEMWFKDLLRVDSVAHAVAVLAAVSAAGLLLGNWKWKGLSLGVSGVLFAGLAAGQAGWAVDAHILEFVREFGLILFVSAIGFQVGPGFVAALRAQGLALNLMALGIVVSGALVAAVLVRVFDLPLAFVCGLYSGAVTNTPSLAAAAQVLSDLGLASPLTGQGYALAYPFGIVGIIVVMTGLRRLAAPEAPSGTGRPTESLVAVNIEVTRADVRDLDVESLPNVGLGLIISRLRRGERIRTLAPDESLHVGDVVLAVGRQDHVAELVARLGCVAKVDLRDDEQHITGQRIIVTKKEVVGRSLGELDLDGRFHVAVTRVHRADQELTAEDELRLQYGDQVVAVGSTGALAAAAHALGVPAPKHDAVHVFPLMAGIGLGVVAGMVPLYLPSLPVPVRLGLAGGPLLVALAFGALWHQARLPNSALQLSKELGIALFLAAVGLKSGAGFLATITGPIGLTGFLAGAAITVIPLVVVGLIATLALKLSFTSLCGLLAGSMTDPPALAFAQGLAKPEAVSLAYATVYPVTMIGRILSGQLLVILLSATPATSAQASAVAPTMAMPAPSATGSAPDGG